MRSVPYILISALIAFYSCSSERNDSDILKYSHFIDRLSDLKSLAILPNPEERALSSTSYDRKSTFEDGKYINWTANDDGITSQIIRYEGNKEVIFDAIGPAVINRIWMGQTGSGNIRFYFNNNEEPSIDISIKEFFKGSFFSFNPDQLIYKSASGYNCYIPIPFQESCKIVVDSGQSQYYQIAYSTLPENTKLETFTTTLRESDNRKLRELNKRFIDRLGKYPYPYSTNDVSVKNRKLLLVGESVKIFDIKDAGAIKMIKLRIHCKDREESKRALRKITFQAKWDDQIKPSIWSPIGDFFGSQPGINDYNSLPMGVQNEYFYSYWYMPYAKGALLEIFNQDNADHLLEYEIIYEPLDEIPKNMGRFHAKWHRGKTPYEDRPKDWVLISTKGKGRFVGLNLNVWNPRGGRCMAYGDEGPWWWGEGDEKFFVDGEPFPSIHGTGTDHYFGLAWANPTVFFKPYHGQTYSEDNIGYQTFYRWHISDNIPFQESFDGSLEKYFPDYWPTQYSCVSYWYLSPKGKDDYDRVDMKDRYNYEIPFEYINVFKEKDALEAENLSLNSTDGKRFVLIGHDFPDFGQISNDKLLFWTSENDSASLELDLLVKENGTYKIEGAFIKWPNAGIFCFYVNKESLTRDIDLYGPRNKQANKKIYLGTASLKRGINHLHIKLVGSNKQLKGSPSLLLDYLKLKKT